MKRRSLFVLFTVMALVAAACSGGDDGSTDASDSGGGSGEPVQITLWHGYGEPGERNGVENYEADSMEQLINEFNQTHPDIEVDNVFCCSNDNALQKVTVALQGGQQPDITYQYGTSLPSCPTRRASWISPTAWPRPTSAGTTSSPARRRPPPSTVACWASPR